MEGGSRGWTPDPALRSCHSPTPLLQWNGERQQFDMVYGKKTKHLTLVYFIQQYLTCLKTSRSLTDKLSFDVGLQEDSIGTNKSCKSCLLYLVGTNVSICSCLCQMSIILCVDVFLNSNRGVWAI